ncbi:MAG: cell division protein ZipA, partial [Gammaproteobacteria bacterium]
LDLDDLDEGVGEVRIVARTDDDLTLYGDETSPAHHPDVHQQPENEAVAESESAEAAVTEATEEQTPRPKSASEPAVEKGMHAEARQATETGLAETVLVLNIMARDGSTLSGKSINSLALANKLVFGSMDIYHRMDDHDQPVFSLVNMVKPGSFDPSAIHDLTTPGISLFMQLPGPANASGAFNEMLQTAYRMSEMLEARLCDQRRQPLTESVVEKYRNTAASFDDNN